MLNIYQMKVLYLQNSRFWIKYVVYWEEDAVKNISLRK